MLGGVLAEIIYFAPRHTRNVEANLRAFIKYCRHSIAVYGGDLNWEQNCWRGTGFTFGNIEHRGRVLCSELVMRQPFLDFAKAYCRYQEGLYPRSGVRKIIALRCVERALVMRGNAPSVTDISGRVLDHAVTLGREAYSAGVAYAVGRELALLASFLREKGLTKAHLDWKNPVARPNSVVRTGAAARQRQLSKLPSDTVLEALAAIFASRPTEARDIFTSSVAAMLLCAPCRISELLSLPADCEVWEARRDGKRAYGWRFQPGKGGVSGIKWIPSSMESLAIEAIARVRRVTEDARRLAGWLEDAPQLFYRHLDCPAVSEETLLGAEEIAAALDLSGDRRVAKGQLNGRGLSQSPYSYTLSDLNRWARTYLPRQFPWFDVRRRLRYRDALFAFLRGQLRTDVIFPCPVRLERPTVNVFNTDLRRKADGKGKSIFMRHGWDASLKVSSHQFRHYLNTLAQRGGLSQAELARWSGRTDVRQNRAYDHMSEFELVDMLRSRDPALSFDRPMQEIAQRLAERIPMTQQEFNGLAAPTAHVTEFGFCVHDFVMSPCQRFRDCLNCTEQVCIKGDQRLERLKHRLEQVSNLCKRASIEIANGTAGADRWYDIHAKTETRLRQLIAILEEPSVPDGTIVRLHDPDEFSPIRRALGGTVQPRAIKSSARARPVGVRKEIDRG